MKGERSGPLALGLALVMLCAGVMSARAASTSVAPVVETPAVEQQSAAEIAAKAGIASHHLVSAKIIETRESVKLVTGAERQSSVPGGALAYAGQPVFVRVSEQTLSTVERIPYELQYRPEESSAGGRVVVLKTGTGGERERVFHLTYENGSLKSVALVSESQIEPTGGNVAQAGTSVYRGGAIKELYVEATAYTPTVQETDSDPWTTASGMKSGLGIVAVDPGIIPLGSKLYVEGYGYAIAGDTGGAIKGDRIDVFFYSHDEMISWGRRWVRVFVLP
ncbi:MAG: 3D domain-containing protein [Candidatus Cryosericum sp.]